MRLSRLGKIRGGLRLTNNGKETVVHYRTVIGDNVTIGKNVTIGSRNHIGPPQIGDSVWIGNNACLLGDIHIGNHVVIEEDAVVVHSVPSNSYVYGVPARNRELTDKGKESY